MTDHARPLPQPVAGDLPQPYVFLRKIAKPAPRCQANARFSRMGTAKLPGSLASGQGNGLRLSSRKRYVRIKGSSNLLFYIRRGANHAGWLASGQASDAALNRPKSSRCHLGPKVIEFDEKVLWEPLVLEPLKKIDLLR